MLWGEEISLTGEEKKQKCLDFILLWTAARNGALKNLMNSLLLFQSFQGEVAFGVGDLFLCWGACQLEKALSWHSAASLEG